MESRRGERRRRLFLLLGRVCSACNANTFHMNCATRLVTQMPKLKASKVPFNGTFSLDIIGFKATNHLFKLE